MRALLYLTAASVRPAVLFSAVCMLIDMSFQTESRCRTASSLRTTDGMPWVTIRPFSIT
jgi:hypothetical protein